MDGWHSGTPSRHSRGTCLLIAKCIFTPLLPTQYGSFEYHVVLVTTLVKIYVVVIYSPPRQH